MTRAHFLALSLVCCLAASCGSSGKSAVDDQRAKQVRVSVKDEPIFPEFAEAGIPDNLSASDMRNGADAMTNVARSSNPDVAPERISSVARLEKIAGKNVVRIETFVDQTVVNYRFFGIVGTLGKSVNCVPEFNIFVFANSECEAKVFEVFGHVLDK